MATIGVLLSGCGVYDGSEIHEAVLTLLALDRAGAEIICMAPDIDQFDVVNHLTGKTQHEKRSVLAESARIARGNIRNLKSGQSRRYRRAHHSRRFRSGQKSQQLCRQGKRRRGQP